MSNPPGRPKSPERGVALIMVIFMIVLASALLVSLSDSTYVAMRLNGAAERRVKAEYVLKSAVNFARILLKSDTTPHDDPQQDLWMRFSEGAEVPGELLGLGEVNVKISLQISSEAGKVPIRKLLSATGDRVDENWRPIVTQLFKVLGFDNDTKEVDQTGKFEGRHFKSEELVANLIDYMDIDKESYSGANFAQGIEGELPSDSPFRNEAIDSISSELSSIPGFTPQRVQRLLPFLTTTNPRAININAAPRDVIQALSPDIDEGAAQRVIDFRTPAGGGPFTQVNKVQQLQSLLGLASESVNRNTDVFGSWYEVITKVEYGTAYFMARAILKSNGTGRLPAEWSLDIY